MKRCQRYPDAGFQPAGRVMALAPWARLPEIFVDFLALAGQSVWQILPVGPTSYGDSPYQSCSAFAGNPYFIDLDQLAADGLLKPEDYAKENWGTNPNYCDYALLYQKRYKVLRKAYAAFFAAAPGAGVRYPLQR